MKFDFKQLTGTVIKSVKHKSPEILMILGIAGMAGAAVLTAKAAKKAEKQLEERKEELEVEELDKKEVVKTVWKTYIPPVAVFAASTACIVGADQIRVKRYADLLTAYKLGETTFKEYKKQVVKELGPEKEKEVTKKANNATIEKTYDDSINKDVYHTNFGDVLFLDSVLHRYFRCSRTALQNQLTAINNRIQYYDFISINDFWEDLNLPYVPIAENQGWNAENHQHSNDIRLYFEESNLNNELCWIVSYDYEDRIDNRRD